MAQSGEVSRDNRKGKDMGWITQGEATTESVSVRQHHNRGGQAKKGGRRGNPANKPDTSGPLERVKKKRDLA